MRLPLWPYKKGDVLQASTINALQDNTGFYTNSGMVGGGTNVLLTKPANEQNMADLTDSGITEVKSHSVIYCLPKTSGGYQWSKTKLANGQAYYTLANESFLVMGTVVNGPSGVPSDPPRTSAAEGKRMVAVQPMIPGQRYVLRSQDSLEEGTACIWNGVKLIPATREELADFIIYRFEFNPTPPPYTEMLFGERPRQTPMDIEHEKVYYGPESPVGWAPMPSIDGVARTRSKLDGRVWSANDGMISPGIVPYYYRNDAEDILVDKWFADNVFALDGKMPGYPDAVAAGEAARTANSINRPVTYKNPTGAGYSEAIYRPSPEMDEGDGTAVVKFPIQAILTYMDIDPRPNGSSNRLANTTVATTMDDHGYNYVWSDSEPRSRAASFFNAKCLGLVEPVGVEVGYQKAYYSKADGRITWEMFVVVAGSGSAPSNPPSEWSGLLDISCTYTNVHSYQVDGITENVYRVTGEFLPAPTGTPIYADLNTRSVPLYRRKMKVATSASAPMFHSAIPNSNVKSTAGWIKYEYDYQNDTETNAVPKEEVKIPPPSIPGATFISADEDGACTFRFPDDTEYTTPRQTQLSGYGDFEFKSCSQTTGICTYEFTPDSRDYDNNSDFPFWYGITPQKKMMGTFQTKNAQKDWVPAISPTSDYDEILSPGIVVPYEEKTIQLHYRVHAKYVEGDEYVAPGEGEEDRYYDYETPFKFAVVTPPEKYHTDIAGTPTLKIVKLTRELPTEEEIDGHVIDEQDCWITSLAYIDTFPATRSPGELTYAVVQLNANWTANIREPFGAFNDCSNAGNLALFMRYDVTGIEYPCCCRLDYIPYGYAVPSKTPSCFYKATTEENCAPRMRGVPYDILRQEDTELSLKGACYVPCTTLARS